MPEKIFQRKARIVQLDFLKIAERRARPSQKAKVLLNEICQRISAIQSRIKELEKRPIRSSQDAGELREWIGELNSELEHLQKHQKTISKKAEALKKKGF